jgi:hypothetical protein
MPTAVHRRLYIPGRIGSKREESSLQLDLTVLREYVSQLHHHGKVRTLRQSVEVCTTCSGGCGLLCGNEPSAPRGCVAENRTDSADDKV